MTRKLISVAVVLLERKRQLGKGSKFDMILMTEERASGKKIVVALSLAVMLLALCFVLQGCETEQGQADSDAAGVFRFISVPSGYILVDQHTGVMYWMTFDGYHGTYSPITLLVNSDGTPKVWEGDLQ